MILLPQSVYPAVNRNFMLARTYASAGRYQEAADTLLLITGNLVTRKTVEDAARLLRQAPTKVRDPAALPLMNNEMNFSYAYAGALERVIELSASIAANRSMRPSATSRT